MLQLDLCGRVHDHARLVALELDHLRAVVVYLQRPDLGDVCLPKAFSMISILFYFFLFFFRPLLLLPRVQEAMDEGKGTHKVVDGVRPDAERDMLVRDLGVVDHDLEGVSRFASYRVAASRFEQLWFCIPERNTDV